jgi:hypothetical protein
MAKVPHLGKDANPGGARFCEEHDRLECVKNRRVGRGVCHARAVKGIDSCRAHSGLKLEQAKAKGHATINLWSAQGEHPSGKVPDSGMVVMSMLQQSWLRCAAYGELLKEQVATGGAVTSASGMDVTGLIGHRYGAAGKDGHIYAVSEEARALVVLESQERDRAVKYAETAHKMGISTRLTDMAEKWGDAVIGRIMVVITGLNLTPEQEARVPDLIQAHLGQIEIG